MTNETKIIVKVGKKSQLKFSHCKVFRAIMVEDLTTLAEKNKDCHIAIIEGIDSGEEEAVKSFITSFKETNSNNLVLFFVPDENDMVTSGLADELDYNIYMTLRDLYKTIYDILGINVSIYLDDKKELSKMEQDSIPEGVTDIFGSLGTEEGFENDIADAIKSIDDIDNETVSKEPETVVSEEPIQEVVEESKVVEEVETVVKEEPIQEVVEESKVDKESKTVTKTSLSKDQKAESKTTKVESKTEKEENKDQKVESEVVEEEIQIEPMIDTTEKEDDTSVSVDLNEVEELRIKLKDTQYDYSVLRKEMQEANSRIDDLTKTVETTKDEKQAIIDRFNELSEGSEVLEDPISLSEYEELQKTVKDYTERNERLETSLDKCHDTIDANNETIRSQEESLNELHSKLEEINRFIDSGEVHKEIVEQHKAEMDKITEEKEGIAKKLSDTDSLVDSLTESLDSATSKLDKEVEYREVASELLQSAFSEIKNINNKLESKESEVSKLSTENSVLTDELTKSKDEVVEQSSKIEELNKEVATFDKRLELANSYSEQQIKRLNDTNSELSAKLKLTEEQLAQKERQYITLVEQSGIDSSAANSLMQTNQTLEQVNKTLREQLSTTTKEMESMKSNRIELQTQVNNYKSQCQQLNDTLNAISSNGGMVAGTGAVRIKPIQYKGNAQIISVFGSGSFGITTTAMSIAAKLCTTSKVLYIDFDLITPKADAWFNKLPLCRQVPGIDASDVKMTGLGIFYEKGIHTFSTYIDKIVNVCDKTKGGEIDYLSGVYYRVDNLKLSTADYTGFFNTLGSMYNYIIIDFGRLGSNDVNDMLIKTVSDICIKNVVVTTPDKFEVRNFKTKLLENKLDLNKIAWLVNLCESTTIDDKVKQMISPSKYGMMLMDQNLHNKREKFLRNKLTKDKMELFINSVLFAR